MSTFAILDSDIIRSSIWSADDCTRIVWITILAMKDEDGFVRGDDAGIAAAARVKVDACSASLRFLESPDPNSGSPECEGRRIVKVAGGWLVVNHAKYRDKNRTTNRKAYLREYMREYMRNSRSAVRQESLTESNAGITYVCASVSASGISGEGGVGEERPPRDGLLGLVDRIRSCRPEYAKMREQDIVATLNRNQDSASVEMVVIDWCIEQANAMTPMGNPIASLRKRIDAITEADEKNPYAKFAKEGAR